MHRLAVVAFGIMTAACAQPGKATRQRNAHGQPGDEVRARVSEVVTPDPRFIDDSLLGSELGPDGKVSKQSEPFTPGQPVYITAEHEFDVVVPQQAKRNRG